MVIIMSREFVLGVGKNDANYKISSYSNGKRVICHFYQTWHNMLKRCYDKKYHEKHPSYADCLVCNEWLTFSNFKSWMEKQDWIGKHLDKDILVTGNRIYSPDTCVFIDGVINTFLGEGQSVKNKHLIGAVWNKKSSRFISSCRNPFTNSSDYLGFFDNETSSHQAWKKRKHELACQLADIQTDQRVAKALRVRYA